MANTNSALALALGAGGGLALWYLLRDNTKNPAPGSAAPVAPAAPAAPPAPTAPARQAAPAESSPVQMACTVRLDAAGLTVDPFSAFATGRSPGSTTLGVAAERAGSNGAAKDARRGSST